MSQRVLYIGNTCRRYSGNLSVVGRRGPKPRPIVDRLMERVEQAEDGCWLWTGYVMPNGYAKLTTPNGRSNLAHRLMHEELVGPIPGGLDLDHLCRVRACVNPAHLEPVTRRENLARAPHLIAIRVRGPLPRPSRDRGLHNRDKTACPAGHPYDDENTRWYRGSRRCRACDREQHNARYAARRGGDAQ